MVTRRNIKERSPIKLKANKIIKRCEKFEKLKQKEEILFHEAIFVGDFEKVKEYVEILKVDLNCKTRYGNGFHIAIEENHLNIIKYFLSKNVKIILNEKGETIYHLAIDNFSILKFLVKRFKNKININTKTQKQKNLLHIVENASIARFLIEEGVDVNAFASSGASPLIIAAQRSNFSLIKSIIETTKRLNIKLNINDYFYFEDKEKNEYSALMYAIYSNDLNIIKYLIENGADLTAISNEKFNSLHFAVLSENFENFKFIFHLLRGKIDLNAQTKLFKETILHKVLKMKNYNEKMKIINFLLLIDEINLFIPNHNGITFINQILKNNLISFNSFIPLFKMKLKNLLIMKTNEGENILHIACKEGRKKIVLYLIETEKFDLEEVDFSLSSLLHLSNKNLLITAFILFFSLDLPLSILKILNKINNNNNNNNNIIIIIIIMKIIM